jgi:hypothetical protein
MLLFEASAFVFGIAILLALCGERIVAAFALLVVAARLVIGVVTAGVLAAVTPGDPTGVVWALISLGVIGVAGRLLYKRRSPEPEGQFVDGVRCLLSRPERRQISRDPFVTNLIEGGKISGADTRTH